MHLSYWQSLNWMTGFIGYAVLMAVLVLKKRYVTFPWFTFLLAQEIVQSVVLFEAHSMARPKIYFYIYWCFELLDACVRVAVFFELARITSRLLKENSAERIRILLGAALIAGSICAGVVLGGHGVGNLMATTALKISLCTSILGSVLVLSFVLTTFLEGVRSRIHSQALAYGLFFYFSGKLLAQAGLLFGGQPLWFKLQNYTQPLYIVCLFAWSIILWFDEPRRVLTEEMDRLQQTFVQLERGRVSTHLSPETATSLSDVIGL